MIGGDAFVHLRLNGFEIFGGKRALVSEIGSRSRFSIDGPMVTWTVGKSFLTASAMMWAAEWRMTERPWGVSAAMAAISWASSGRGEGEITAVGRR
ncbi:hypothetical protein, partial [Desulfosporosinus metallidurans]|uniref:hypothetical protein n=1 Tax=Desulfosporosinus metallidurans TaxID=1888891 RepID=UPI001A9A2E1A